MIAPLLKSALEPVVERHRRMRFLNGLTIWWLAIALLAFVVAEHVIDSVDPSWGGWMRVLILAGLIGAWIVRAAVRAWEPDYREIARRIEKSHPELHALLVTAVEQQPDRRTGALNYLQQHVIADAIRATRQQQWLDAIPVRRWLGATALQAVALVALGFALVALSHPVERHRVVHTVAKSTEKGVDVTPGDVSLERGSGLVVLANFKGEVPGEATLVIEPRNEAAQRIPLVKSLNDPVYGGGLPEVRDDLKYRIEYAGEATRDFTVKVFEHPRLERADATLRYPEYTKQAEKTVPDTKRVGAVVGTKLDVTFQLNKPVKSAVLVTKDGKELPLAVDPSKAAATLKDFEIKNTQAYELRLTDADGRANKLPAHFTVDALANRVPELKFAMPKGDRKVSPIEEVTFKGEAWDDFGLARYGMTINVAGRGEQDIELGRDTHADERREFSHVLKLEDVGVKPDELVSWYLWAEDTGPDGKMRRTASNMYFGEVRPFEEIYRAGDPNEAEQREQREQQQQNGGGGAGEQARKLGETQKQIVSATWNLKRNEDASAEEKKPGDKYRKDEPVVRDSQGDALKQAQSMAENLQDPKSIALVQNVTTAMQAAQDHLAKAGDSLAPLPDALASEQTAYDALLKLSAHEYEVTRRQRNRQQGQGQGQQANQRQLDELEMKDEKQRYETAKEAAPMQNQEKQQQQREQLAIVNRLKELAQRQQDINERLKELQTALQEAKTPQQKEELSQQLKRLREEEQQLLSDLDEGKQKMEQASQQSQLADERKRLEETRNEAQQAAEAMERNAPSQALANGARTARQLQEIRDDVRKKTTGQFNDEMREMRSNARELAENQQKIGEKLQGQTPQNGPPSLAGGDENRDGITKDLEKQQEQLSAITDQMKRVSEEAEAVEPLLSKELYDTLRKTTQAGTDQKLKSTKLYAERGINSQAQKIEKDARNDVEELKTGVERAAESVLGNEAESLKQARDELDALSQQIDREVSQARPDLAENRQPQATRNGANRNGNQEQQGQRQANANQQAANNGQANGAQPGQNGNGERTAENQRNGQGRNRGQRAGEQPQNGQAENQNESGQRTAQNGNRQGGQGREQTEQQPQDGAQPGEQNAQNDQNGQQEGNRGQGNRTAQNNQQGRGQRQGQQGQDGQQGQAGQRGQRGQRGQGEQGGQPGQEGEQAQAQDQQDPQGDQQDQQQTAQSGQGRAGNGRNRQGGNQQGGDRQGQQQPQGGGEGGGQNAQTAQTAAGGRANDLFRRNAGAAGGGGGGGGGALTGEGFVDWSDRLRNVEEMIDSPELRNEAARIREVAKGVRVEFKKHSTQPDWDLVKSKISKPLVELRNRLSEQLAARDSKESLVPIDRDPVPPKYAERVRSYYEELGRSK